MGCCFGVLSLILLQGFAGKKVPPANSPRALRGSSFAKGAPCRFRACPRPKTLYYNRGKSAAAIGPRQGGSSWLLRSMFPGGSDSSSARRRSTATTSWRSWTRAAMRISSHGASTTTSGPWGGSWRTTSLKEAAKIDKASGEPNRKKVASITWDQVKTIAEGKMPDLNAFTLKSAMKMVAGTARSLGITISGEFSENI